MTLEIEAKLTCNDGFAPGEVLERLGEVARVEGPEIVVQEDRYYDTRSRSLAGAGLSARCRKVGTKRSIDVKPVPILRGVVMERQEISGPVEARQQPGAAIRRLVEERLPIKLRGAPVEQVVLRTRRQTFVISTGDCTAELCIDQVTARASGRRKGVPFGEVELELVEGEREAFDSLVRRLVALPTLSPSESSKYQRGLELLGMRGYIYGGPRPGLDPAEPADVAARRICLSLLRTMRSHEPGTRVGLDPEQLHKMRVASRRLRSAMQVFGDCFAGRNGDFLRRNLEWLADVLGRVRDLDVLKGDLAAWRASARDFGREGWDRLSEIVDGRWRLARGDLIEALDTSRYRRLLERAEEEFTRAPRRRLDHPGRGPAGEVAAEQLHRRVRKLGRRIKRCRETGRACDVHRLRIAGKKLRYTAEFFHSFLDAETNKRIKRLTVFQDELGRFQDRCVQGEMARALVVEAVEDGEPPALLYALGRMAGSSEAAVAAARERIDAILADLGAERLIRRLDRRRLDGSS